MVRYALSSEMAKDEGLAQGRAEGKAEGKLAERRDIALNLLK